MEKILSIVWYKVLPPVFGGQKGIAHFNEQLARHHSLICLCSKNNEPGAESPYKVLPSLPTNKFQFLDPSTGSKIKKIAAEKRPSFIIVEHPYHGLAAIKATKKIGAKLIVHSHNIESARFRQLGKWWWQLLRIYEKWVHRKADINIFKTGTDRDFAIHHFHLNAEKCLVVPYGIKKPERNENAAALVRERHNIKTTEKLLLFAGTLDYTPNTEAVQSIIKEIIPQLENAGVPFKFLICGRDQKKSFRGLSHPSLIVAGEVTDISNYFQAADVFVNPVRSGGGIQTKNIDALANNCTVVCFENTSNGIPAEICSKKLFTAAKNDWDAFALNIIKGLATKESTPEAFFSYFDWENCIQPLWQKLKPSS